MRILIDGQTLHTHERYRGIGRYFIEVLSELAARHEHSITLASFQGMDLRGLPGNISAVTIDVDAEADAALKTLQYRQGLEDIAERDGFDVFWNPNPLMDNVLFPGILKGCGNIATVHDLIPLIFPDKYLYTLSTELFEGYLSRVLKLPLYDRIIAVSNSTRNDAVKFASVGEDRITVIHEGINQIFFERQSADDKEEVSFRYGLPKDFIFTLGGPNFRKNNENLVRAFSILIKRHGKDTNLVFGSDFPKESRERLEALAKESGVFERLFFIGSVPDGDLGAVYSLSSAFIFPSLYEGFGLPILEAFASGTPVLAAENSSIPEIVGEAGLYFDGGNAEDIAEKASKLLGDKDLQNSCKEAGLKRAREFSWKKTALDTLALFESALKEERKGAAIRKTGRKKQRLAFFSPFNPQHSGIADYSEELLIHLKGKAEIDLFVDGITPSNPEIIRNFRFHDHKEFEKMAGGYDNIIYHMGNNTLHEYIYAALKKYPGITVLHDFNIHPFIRVTTLDKNDRDAYGRELEGCYGALGRVLVEKIKNEDYNLSVHSFPLNRKIFEASKAVIVHSQWCRDQVYGGNVFVVPSGVNIEPELKADELKALRRALGMDDNTFAIACFGDIVYTKRIDVIIKAFSIFRLFTENAKLYLVGKNYPGMEAKLARLIEFHGLKDSVVITGKVDMDLFQKYMKASDVILNLRYPTLGETSASLTRGMSFGKPVIISNVAQFREYPDGCCLKLDVGEREVESLFELLTKLNKDAELRGRIGGSARRYVEGNCSWPKVAERYLDIVESFSGN
ncbi:MAG: glycosyltransferase [Deltaproteobacteria bacterium]|nr:glycosyltransferase [Deltaproteobacteria bacterium]